MEYLTLEEFKNLSDDEQKEMLSDMILSLTHDESRLLFNILIEKDVFRNKAKELGILE